MEGIDPADAAIRCMSLFDSGELSRSESDTESAPVLRGLNCRNRARAMFQFLDRAALASMADAFFANPVRILGSLGKIGKIEIGASDRSEDSATRPEKHAIRTVRCSEISEADLGESQQDETAKRGSLVNEISRLRLAFQLRRFVGLLGRATATAHNAKQSVHDGRCIIALVFHTAKIILKNLILIAEGADIFTHSDYILTHSADILLDSFRQAHKRFDVFVYTRKRFARLHAYLSPDGGTDANPKHEKRYRPGKKRNDRSEAFKRLVHSRLLAGGSFHLCDASYAPNRQT